jgi:hypothetical protein
MRPVGKAGASLTQLREGGLCPLRVPRHQNDSCSERGKPRSSDLPDAGGGTGDDNDLAVNGGLLRSKFRSNAAIFTPIVCPVSGLPVLLQLAPLAGRGRIA